MASRMQDLRTAVQQWAVSEKTKIQKTVDSHERLRQGRGDLAADAVESALPEVEKMIADFLAGG